MRRVLGHIGSILPCAAIAATTAVPPAQAAVAKGNWEIGGYAVSSRYSNSSTVDDTLSFTGVRGTYHFQDRAGVEVDIDLAKADPTDRSLDIEFDVTKLGVSYVRNFQSKRNEKLAPLLIFGAGLIEVDDSTDTSSSTFLRAGGGVRYFFSPRVGLRVDGRLYRWRGDNEAVPRSSFFSFDLTIGVSFLFGKGS